MGCAPLLLEEAPSLLTSAATSALRPARLLTLAAARAAAALVTATAAAAAEAATAARDDASAPQVLPPLITRISSALRLALCADRIAVEVLAKTCAHLVVDLTIVLLYNMNFSPLLWKLQTCGGLHVRDGCLLASHHEALSLPVGVVSLLVILVGLVDELEVQVALAALTGYAGLQANLKSRFRGRAHPCIITLHTSKKARGLCDICQDTVA